jgi:DNA-binding transcriptional ArsR family regulator
MPADPFEVLADPTRRRLIQALRTGEHSVNDLVKVVDINQPGVSKQLRVLHDAGFVQVRPDKQRRLYSLRGEPFREIDSWIDDYRHLWEGRIDRLSAQLNARTKRKREAQPQPPHKAPQTTPKENPE